VASDHAAPTASESEYSYRTWEEIDQLPADRIAVLPAGAVEVYGPHLPLGSDFLVAEAVGRLVAARIGALCLPVIPVGYSADLMSFPGTLYVPPEAFKGYVSGICRSLLAWGFRRILFLNTHLGNVRIIDQVADELTAAGEAKCLQIDWWRFANPLGSDLWESGDWSAGHAGELGTSVLQYLRPELVHSERQVDFIPAGPMLPAGAEDYRPFRQITASSVLGQPSAASAKKGAEVVERALDAIVDLARTSLLER
jgi:creatinine amidohydrolase